jgi:beta-N-acetylhexosaminidase
MYIRKIFIFIFLILLNFWGFSVNNLAKKAEYDWVQDKLNSMTLREKIAQMVISYSDGFSIGENSNEYQRVKNLITNQKIGGIIFFKGNSLQEAELINKFQLLSETPLLISQDFERGTGMRLEDGSIFPNNMGLAATRNIDLAFKMGLAIAKECKAMGIHQNYAPVMDVNNNPDNPIINVRSFGEDPMLVSSVGVAVIKGLQEGGIIATAKHFPGHGDTDIDTHSDLPVIKFGKERLEKVELLPFSNAINAGVKSIMTAHIYFPAYDNTPNIPASLSKNIVTGLLTEELGFRGLKITDALNMAGITKHFSAKEVALMCVNAGIDLILMPQGEEITIDAIETAVKNGDITEDRIAESTRKILGAKLWLGLDKEKLVDVNSVSNIVNSEESKALSQSIADESITLVKNENGNLPFGRRMIKRKETCLIVSLNSGNEKANSDYFINAFSERGNKYFSGITSYDIQGEVKNAEEIIKDSKDFVYVIVPVYAKVKMKTGTVGLPKSQLNLINRLIENGKSVCVISFGNPYLLKGFTGVESYICAYGDGETTINAAVKTLFGDIPFKGKLPVAISEDYKFGTGLTN